MKNYQVTIGSSNCLPSCLVKVYGLLLTDALFSIDVKFVLSRLFLRSDVVQFIILPITITVDISDSSK